MGNLIFAKDCSVTERKAFKLEEGLRRTADKIDTVSPPSHMPNMYPSRTLKIRKYEGGTLEEALPVLAKDQEEGYLTYWNSKQWLKADVWLHQELLGFDERIRESMESKARARMELQNKEVEDVLEEALSHTRTRRTARP